MGKSFPIMILVVAVCGAGYFFTHFEVRRVNGHIVISPKDAGRDVSPSDLRSAVAPDRATIRVASFKLGPLDRAKFHSPLTATCLAQLIGDFDVVAVQDLLAPNEGLIRELTDQVNAGGRQFDFAVSPEVATTPVVQYNAFLFDKSRLEIDRSTICTIEDPSGRFQQKPLAALFRAKGVAPNEAFTFVLVNLDVDPKRASVEVGLLDDVLGAVRKNFHGEDDVVLLGSFGAGPEAICPPGGSSRLTPAVTNTVSLTRGSGLVDNLIFDREATTEFTGRANAVDLIRRLNLDLDRALRISEHMPVWAEFSVFEGGQAGQIATRP